jgi:hypothetical protein
MTTELPQSAAVSAPTQKKRLIICCDGTWMNSDKGYEKGKPQNPSNVTRLARSFKRGCTDGSVQVINYQSGVGTGSSDAVSGGAFGSGIAEVGIHLFIQDRPYLSQADKACSTCGRATLSYVPTTLMVTRSSSSASHVAPSLLEASPA